MYLFSLSFNSVSVSLQETKKTYVILFYVFLTPCQTQTAQTSRYVPFNFSLSWFTWTFLTEYSKGKLERNDKKV